MVIRPFDTSSYALLNIPTFPANAKAWVAELDRPMGYVAYAPLPGLPHLADLFIYIDPPYRRQGFGRKLVQFLLEQLKGSEITQIAAPYDDSNDSLGQFLHHCGFFLEHSEYELTRFNVEPLPDSSHALTTLPLRKGATLMRQLYDTSFQGYPWHQPYVNDEELLDEIGIGGNIYFLMQEGKPIGFAGVSYDGGSAEIEPLGIIPTHRGKGFGRTLVTSLLDTLFRRADLHAVHIVAWSENDAAIKLYQSVGFTLTQTRHYLAHNV